MMWSKIILNDFTVTLAGPAVDPLGSHPLPKGLWPPAEVERFFYFLK